MNQMVRIQALTDIALNPGADELVMSVVVSLQMMFYHSLSLSPVEVIQFQKIFLHLIERSAMKAPIGIQIF